MFKCMLIQVETNLKGFDESEGADAAPPRHQAEGRVGQQLVEVPPGTGTERTELKYRASRRIVDCL